MTDSTLRRRERRVWVAFVMPAMWLVLAGSWITWGVAEHDPLRVGMSVVWLAFAAYWTVRAVQRLRRMRAQRRL